MSIDTELTQPNDDAEFEALCHQLYRAMWGDPGCMRIGRTGQAQYGIDIVGTWQGRQIGVQCKCYRRTRFTMATVREDIAKVEQAGLPLDHLLFATTATNDAKVALEVHQLSVTRKNEGKFTVSVDFWEDICGHIWGHPEIGRKYVRNFPGSLTVATHEIAQNSAAMLTEVHRDSSLAATGICEILIRLEALSATQSICAKGDEADPVVAHTLDLIRDRIQQGRTRDARQLLEGMGDPDAFRDKYSRFRWHTNRASVDLQDGLTESAIEGYLKAYALAPTHEKAIANRVHALLLSGEADTALLACDEGLAAHPDSLHLWALRIHARHAVGVCDPEQGLPEAIRDTPDLLYARARLASKQGRLEDAAVLSRACLMQDGGTLEAKCAYLAEALAWATDDTIRAVHANITAGQRTALEDAVGRLEPLEQTLAAIEAEAVALEAASNAVNALLVLGHHERVQELARRLLARHPSGTALLRVRLLELNEKGDIDAIRVLTDEHLQEIDDALLPLLAAIAAEHGDVMWFQRVFAQAEARLKPQGLIDDVRILSFQAMWVSGESELAMAQIEEYLGHHPNHIAAHCLRDEFLARLGDKERSRESAIALAKSCATRDLSTADLLRVATRLYALDEYATAAPLYRRLVKEPGSDELTVRLLHCYVESDQRRLALSLLEELDGDARDNEQIRWIECNLARRMSDWQRLKVLLIAERTRAPERADFSVALVTVLYRLGQADERLALLSADPKFAKTDPQLEFEFAKHQSAVGLTEAAIRRVYRIYRDGAESTTNAGYFLSQLLLAQDFRLQSPSVVTAGVSVQLRSTAQTWVVAIDLEAAANPAWPELVSPDSALARQLLGRSVGDVVEVVRGHWRQEAEIVAVQSIFGYAAEKAQERISASAEQEGPLWSMPAFLSDGEVNVEALVSTAKLRREACEAAFGSYAEQGLPLCSLAKMLGTDVISLLLEWPSTTHRLLVDSGSQDERLAATAKVDRRESPFVADLVAIAELTRRDVFEAAKQVMGRVLVPRSAEDDLMDALQLTDRQKPAGTLGECDGRVVFAEVSAEGHAQRQAFMRRVLTNLKACEVVPVVGPAQPSDQLRDLNRLLDATTADAIYLALERRAILLSEDGVIQRLYAGVAGGSSCSIQPILLVADARKQLSRNKVAAVLVQKIADNHDFVTVRAQDLLVLARERPYEVSQLVRIALLAIGRPTVEFSSAIRVALEFVARIAKELPTHIVGAYVKLAFDALIEDKERQCNEFRQLFAEALQPRFGRHGRRLTAQQRQHFGRVYERR